MLDALHQQLDCCRPCHDGVLVDSRQGNERVTGELNVVVANDRHVTSGQPVLGYGTKLVPAEGARGSSGSSDKRNHRFSC